MSNILLDNVGGIRFVNRPIAVPYNYRITYKVAQLVLTMATSCGAKGCSMEKLQLISLGLSSKQEMDRLAAFAMGKIQYPLIRFDPSVNRAVLFALAEKVIMRQKNGLLRLTPKGKQFYNELINDPQLLVFEKEYLKILSTHLTEEKISGIMADWRIYDV